MGVENNVGFSRWPEQSDWVGRRVLVCFDYDTTNQMGGEIVRCDNEEPGQMIIRLDDNRYVRSVECMWSFERVKTQ